MNTLALAGLVALAAPSRAQSIPNIRAPIEKAENAANATNKHMSGETGQEVRTVGKQNTGKSSGPAPAPATQPLTGKNNVTLLPTGPAGAAGNAVIPQVTREIFTYEPEGRRDPFYSLILTEDLRPLLSDLRLVAILYAGPTGRSVAVMRDIQTNAQYRVGTGMTLGRMHVAAIRQRAVIFTIDEFGLNRTDSLFLADTSKTRIR
jgi:hypothetical protein